MKTTLIYGSLVILGVFLLSGAHALTCPNSIVCIHNNDGTELCAEATATGINCPAGSHVDPSIGAVVPVCSAGNVACIHQNDNTSFCYPGYICPAGSTQVGPVNLPSCPNNQQMCVYGSMYGCFDYACPSGMTPVGFIDCTIPPKTCEASEKLCVYDIGNAFACQSAGFNCWPGTHEWKPCKSRFDFANNLTVLATGHFIKCFDGLTKRANGNVYCGLPLLDTYSWPLAFEDGKELYVRSCFNEDNSASYFGPLATELGFKSFIATGWLSTREFSLLPKSWITGYFASRPETSYPEYCLINNRPTFFTACGFGTSNANCFINHLEFVA